MRRLAFAIVLFVSSALFVMSVDAQPPGGGQGKEKKGKFGKNGKGGPPPRFTPGNLFPPGLRDQLKLTPEQEKEITSLEKEVKQKLEKVLTPEQLRTIDEFRPPMGPPGGGPGGPDGPPGGPGGPPGGGPGGPPRGDDAPQTKVDGGGIQWFATLDAGLAEAKRTGKPVLFLSAAPHCGGVPGMW